jgi:hypothetical protein
MNASFIMDMLEVCLCYCVYVVWVVGVGRLYVR